LKGEILHRKLWGYKKIMSRKKYTSEDREFEKEFKKSLSVSSYKNEIIDKIYGGKEISPTVVPDYNSSGSSIVGQNETGSIFSIYDNDNMVKTASKLGHLGIASILTPPREILPTPDVSQDSKTQKPQFKLSSNQYHAVQKYPALVEFLGTEKAESLVTEIAAKVNQYMVERIGYNSKEISPKYAQRCTSDNRNIKQYFVGENEEWACVVTASGPFRGDEAILYKSDTDKSFILRKINDNYENITEQFNIVHEFANKETQSPTV